MFVLTGGSRRTGLENPFVAAYWSQSTDTLVLCCSPCYRMALPERLRSSETPRPAMDPEESCGRWPYKILHASQSMFEVAVPLIEVTLMTNRQSEAIRLRKQIASGLL